MGWMHHLEGVSNVTQPGRDRGKDGGGIGESCGFLFCPLNGVKWGSGGGTWYL